MAFSLATYNIRRGGIGREAALATVIAGLGADVVLLQEATAPGVVARLAEGAGMTHWMARQGSSLAFLSREPVVSYRWRRPAWSQHAVLDLVPREGLRLFGVHLSAVHSNWTEWRRVKEVQGLLAMARADGEAHVLAGDFNTLAPGEVLDLARLPPRLRAVTYLTGRRIRWKTVSLMLDAGYVDAFRIVEPNGPGYTFPTWDPHLRLDYAFVPPSLSQRVQRCSVVSTEAAAAASDHLPLEVIFET
jgi:endonuclease/exonuclease/phosphatase family metal-dependent hydrolase